ncbi:ABC transporter [Microbacterium thalli]|uniref:ABC transporter n=1 Tax=Microbacterium thalli TaxID=3027921 RepID=UPI0023666EC5|nr:ABC transporter [Microbacterium thalli]MDD7927931.1 ABC transporter [Microbacterium thalli]
MSDPKYGEPVDEPKPVDDVVGSARAGLADAEASRGAVTADDWDSAYAGSGALPERSATNDSATNDYAATDAASTDRADRDGDADRGVTERSTTSYDAAAAPAASATAASGSNDTWNSPSEWDTPRDGDTTSDADTRRDATDAYRADADARPEASETATRAYRSDDASRTATVSPSEPVGESSGAAAAAPQPQPIFVQAPEAPTPRGNRGAAGAIGLLAAIAFAIIYLGAHLGIGAVRGDVTLANIGDEALAAVTSFWLWVPVVVFFLAFWILGAFINRGRWGLWVLLGLLVGIASYAGHILGQLFQAPFWNIAPSEALRLVGEQAFAPLALVALVAGRELTIWFGAWVAARGKRVTELNAEAQREYERTLEAGPQLHRY